MCCSSLTPPTEKLGLSTHYLCNIIVALHETIHDAKHVIPPIAFAGLGDRSMFSNTWADSQVQVLQYQPPDFQQTPQQVSSHWEDNTTKNYQQQQKIKKRSGTGGDGKLQESSLQFLSLPISLLSIHPTIPFLDVLAYQADVEVAVCILNQLVPLNRKASKALVSFKCKEWGFGWWEETPYSVTWGFGTDHQLAIQGARMDRKAPFKKKKKKAPQVSFWSAFVTAISLSTHLGEVCPSLPRRAFCQLGSTLTLRGGKVRPARVHVMPLQTMCQSQIIVNWKSTQHTIPIQRGWVAEAELETWQVNSFTPVCVCNGASISPCKSYFNFSRTTPVLIYPNKNIGSCLLLFSPPD